MTRALKKTTILLLCLSLLLALFVSPAMAEEGVSPRYGNVSTHRFFFTLNTDGTYEMRIICFADPTVYTSAVAHVTLQRKGLLWWNTVYEETDENTYADMSFTYSGTVTKAGTYRAIMELTVYGTGNANGDPDVLSETIERTIN